MTVTNVHKDQGTRTMTITASFDAPIERVWRLWQDPRLLERWWGPPTYPATFVDHDLSPGGSVTYYMTGPDGDKHHGWWRVLTVDAPRGFTFEDGFADDSGEPNTTMPTLSVRVALSAAPGGGTQLMIETTFPSLQAMNELAEMGMEEGMTAAMGQMDDILHELAAE